MTILVMHRHTPPTLRKQTHLERSLTNMGKPLPSQQGQLEAQCLVRISSSTTAAVLHFSAITSPAAAGLLYPLRFPRHCQRRRSMSFYWLMIPRNKAMPFPPLLPKRNFLDSTSPRFRFGRVPLFAYNGPRDDTFNKTRMPFSFFL